MYDRACWWIKESTSWYSVCHSGLHIWSTNFSALFLHWACLIGSHGLASLLCFDRTSYFHFSYHLAIIMCSDTSSPYLFPLLGYDKWNCWFISCYMSNYGATRIYHCGNCYFDTDIIFGWDSILYWFIMLEALGSLCLNIDVR